MNESSKPKFSDPVFIYRLQLNTPDPDKPTENAAMMFGMDGDTPVILVWPRGDEQKGKGPINARLNTTAFGRDIVTMLRKAVEVPDKYKATLAIEGNRYINGVPEKKHISTFVVAKRSDGVIVVGLFDQDTSRPRILFPLTQLDWVQAPVINGENMSEEELSKRTALFYANYFERLVFDSTLKQTMSERKAWIDEIRARREARSRGDSPELRKTVKMEGDSYEF